MTQTEAELAALNALREQARAAQMRIAASQTRASRGRMHQLEREGDESEGE